MDDWSLFKRIKQMERGEMNEFHELDSKSRLKPRL